MDTHIAPQHMALQHMAPQHMPPQWVDGNDLAGTVGELFAMDVTMVTSWCAACGRVGPLAEAVVYNRAPGLVARCPTCEAVLLRLVRAPDRAWLDLRGVTCLQFALPDR